MREITHFENAISWQTLSILSPGFLPCDCVTIKKIEGQGETTTTIKKHALPAVIVQDFLFTLKPQKAVEKTSTIG